MLKKYFHQVVLASMFLLLPISQIFGDGGPMKPEAAQFQPVDATDLVSLLTGNFNYNLPLLEVPGPEGGWPINLAYSAGVGPNTEATWVGLGWTLNPGAINRFVNGYPDDYMKGGIKTTYDASYSASGFGIGLGFGPFGMSLNFDANGGVSGWNASLDILAALDVGAIGKNVGIGLDISVGSSGVGISTSVGKSFGNGINVGGSIGISSDGGLNGGVGISSSYNKNSLSLLGTSFSSNGSTRFSAMGAGAASGSQNTSRGSSSFNSSSISIPIGMIFGIPLGISLSSWSYKWELHETYWDCCFGGIMQMGYENKYVNDFWGIGSDNIYDEIHGIPNTQLRETAIENSETSEDIAFYKKMERTKVNYGSKTYLLPSSDDYIVSAQGISGVFQPFFMYSYNISDNTDVNNPDENRTGIFKSQTNGNGWGSIHFRFTDDPGGNFLFNNTYPDIQGDMNGRGSRIIKPSINPATGILEGFRIIASDGKIYEFFQPVMSIHNYTQNNGPSNYVDTYEQMSPYATNWLLTSVKGPDYYDFDHDNQVSANDWGYWVKFNYTGSDDLIGWRTPKTGALSLGDNMTSFSTGTRTCPALESIETATHIAKFNTSIRMDDTPPKINNLKLYTTDFGLAINENQWTDPVTGDPKYQTDYTIETKIPQGRKFISKLFNSTLDPYVKIFVSYQIYGRDRYSSRTATVYDGPYSEIPMDSLGYINGTSTWLTDSSGDMYQGSFISHTGTVGGVSNWGYRNGGRGTVTFSFYDNSSDGKLNTKTKVEKLDKIELKKKVFADGVYNEAQTFASVNPLIEGVNFMYDYSLVKSNDPGNPGKLTLESVQKIGFGGDAFLPPTEFSYYGYNIIGSNNDNADYWNGYTRKTDHFSSQLPDEANSDAAAWSLRSINTPLGSTISVTYEADRIFNIAGKKIIDEFYAYKLVGSEDSPEKIETMPLQTSYPSFKAFPYGAHSIYISSEDSERFQQYIDSETPEIYLYTPDEVLQKDRLQCNTKWIHSSILNKDIILLTFSDTYFLAPNLYFYVGPCFIFGGGHRVKSVTISDGEKKKSTLYNYGDGFTASLPSNYSKLSNFVGTNALANSGFNDFGGSPTVMYKNVEVIESDEMLVDFDEWNYSNGKITYEFFVPDQSYLEVGEYPNIKKVTLIDKIGLIGKMKKITTYAHKPGTIGLSEENFYKIKEDQLIYTFSDGICTPDTRKILLNATKNLTDGVPIGMTTQGINSKYMNNDAYDIEITKNNVYLTGTSSVTYKYNADLTSVDSLTTSSQNIGFDYYSGEVLVTSSETSDNKVAVTQKFPAYWQYPAMQTEKNMISQIAETKNYILPEGWGFADPSFPSPEKYIVSASVTIWKKWDIDGAPGVGIWRQGDQYSWVGRPNFHEFNWTVDHGTDDVIKDGSSKMWKRTSNITKYDRYSHPVEEKNMDGAYTSSLFELGDALPVAIVTNAKIARSSDVGNEASYLGFDTLDKNCKVENDFWAMGGPQTDIVVDASAHTGRLSCELKHKVSADPIYGPTRDFLPDNQNGTYVFSCWVRTDGNTNGYLIVQSKQAVDTANTTYPDIEGAYIWLNVGDTHNKWVYKQVVLNLGKIRQLGTQQQQSPAFTSSTNLRIRCFPENRDLAKCMWVDDIRFQPVNSDMSTFTYDPLTLKVTAITDKNNVTSYYEYDNSGRLKLVRDQDKNIVKRHTYHYGRQQ